MNALKRLLRRWCQITDTRILRLDPSVRVGFPVPQASTQAYRDNVIQVEFQKRVALNVERRRG